MNAMEGRVLEMSDMVHKIAENAQSNKEMMSSVIHETKSQAEYIGEVGQKAEKLEEDAVSVQMGHDKVMRHIATGAEYIVGADSSCLMHQNGIILREKLPIKTLHIVEVLAAGL